MGRNISKRLNAKVLFALCVGCEDILSLPIQSRFQLKEHSYIQLTTEVSATNNNISLIQNAGNRQGNTNIINAGFLYLTWLQKTHIYDPASTVFKLVGSKT